MDKPLQRMDESTILFKQKTKEEIRMEKLAYSKLNSLSDLTKTGMNLFLHLVFLSDEAGNVIRYSYKSAREELGICMQSYYNARNELEKKGHIHVNLAGNIKILGNEEYECAKGDIYLNKNYYHSEAFYRLKANEKFLILYFMYNAGVTGYYIRRKDEMISDLTSLLIVKRRQIRSYLHTLRKCMDISIKQGCYVIMPKRDYFRHKYVQNPQEVYLIHNVKEVLYNEGFECTEKQAKDIVRVTRQYIKKGNDLVKAAFMNTIVGLVHYGFKKDSVREERARRHHKKKVSVPFFHKLFKKSLNSFNVFGKKLPIPETMFSFFVYNKGAGKRREYAAI